MSALEIMYSALASWRVAGLTAAASLIFVLVFFPASAKKFRPKEGRQIIHLQLAFTVERFRGILLEWGEAIADSPKWLKESILRLDYLFPVLYATAFASLYAALTSRPMPSVSTLFFFVIPYVAGALDWLENTLHLVLLRGVDTNADVEAAQFDAKLVKAATVAAAGKFALLTLSILACVAAAVQIVT